MSIRVLSTDQGKDAIRQLRSILDGGLAEQVASVKQNCQVLTDPNVWDGMLAQDFRANTWPSTESALNQMAEALSVLQANVQDVNTDIMTAGGNSF